MQIVTNRRYRIKTASVEGVAPQQPPDREPTAAQRAEPLDGLGGIRTATGLIPTGRSQPRADRDPVERDEPECDPRGQADRSWRHRPATNRASAASRSRPSNDEDASAVPGIARTTVPLPASSTSNREASSATQPPAHPVSRHAGTDGLAHDEADDRRIGGESGQVVHDEVSAARATTRPDNRRKVGRPAHSVCGRQHGRDDRSATQADSSPRPLRRREDRIARPARVRIRSRKPCVFARRRLFGWKVRLLTVGLHHGLHIRPSPGDRARTVCNPETAHRGQAGNRARPRRTSQRYGSRHAQVKPPPPSCRSGQVNVGLIAREFARHAERYCRHRKALLGSPTVSPAVM